MRMTVSTPPSSVTLTSTTATMDPPSTAQDDKAAPGPAMPDTSSTRPPPTLPPRRATHPEKARPPSYDGPLSLSGTADTVSDSDSDTEAPAPAGPLPNATHPTVALVTKRMTTGALFTSFSFPDSSLLWIHVS
ncbi:hypothetical protein NEOLEDRAFT_645689 [Neolentinus lepideus HHB14362 ss-1]|uniref:Uncharacterized protein n=1 Tax=Neolentinus lepideus HHB14362 ss-1 TaxID=1314782 RepID=A0A165ML41_9AGAM|nr:hypothetical protein NEOLEDRAFT_1143338 [Neolentinus lepideus HHB14362 ss-1]KZT22606.1 hypothetical protein NEOLEDRAFT_645689 [Neolentinus lepideus HHB14362 ss-1]